RQCKEFRSNRSMLKPQLLKQNVSLALATCGRSEGPWTTATCAALAACVGLFPQRSARYRLAESMRLQ
ncbi:MAG: hypothetical protein WA813_21480, partial [Beijerinckiaceae bacterium]